MRKQNGFMGGANDLNPWISPKLHSLLHVPLVAPVTIALIPSREPSGILTGLQSSSVAIELYNARLLFYII
jgi:hypothetical protein